MKLFPNSRTSFWLLQHCSLLQLHELQQNQLLFVGCKYCNGKFSQTMMILYSRSQENVQEFYLIMNKPLQQHPVHEELHVLVSRSRQEINSMQATFNIKLLTKPFNNTLNCCKGTKKTLDWNAIEQISDHLKQETELELD